MGTSSVGLNFIKHPEEDNEMGGYEDPSLIPSFHHFVDEITSMELHR